jgi:hypothetical protein
MHRVEKASAGGGSVGAGNPSAGGGESHKAFSESRFVALRGSSSESAPADGHNPRTPWPSAQPTQGGETTLQLRVVSLQTRSGPWGSHPKGMRTLAPSAPLAFPGETTLELILLLLLVVPINTQKVLQLPQREMVPYSLPVRPHHRQLTKRDLGSFDFKLLNSIERSGEE